MKGGYKMNCIECEIANDYPCEKWHICPNDADYEDRLLAILNDKKGDAL